VTLLPALHPHEVTMKPLRTLAVLALLLGSTSLALAAPRVAVTPLRAPVPLALDRSVVSLASSATCGALYSCTQNVLGLYYPAGAGVELADDLHMTGPGHLCSVDIGYYKDTPGVTGAAIAFYANDPLDSIEPFALLAGPYVVSDLPTGTNIIHLDLEPGTGMPDVTQDIWLGVSFSTDNTGLLVAGPPELGTSDDLFYLTPPGQMLTFCGDLTANFYLAVHANEFTVPTATTTWGRLKQLYR
jgi:hypothetical protein